MPTISARSPNTTPMTISIATTKAFSLGRLFILKRMSKPTPAPAKSPDIIAPVEMTPDIASLVRATEDAQFGIIPTIAERRWLITGRAKSVPESASSPTKNTKALTNRVTTNTKRETLRV